MKDKLKLTVKKLYQLVKTIKFTVIFKTPVIDFSLAPSILPAFHLGAFLFPFPCCEQALHQIVLWACSAVFGGAVFLHDLIYLIPQAVCLVHVVDADIDKGGRDRLARCGMLGEVAQGGGHFLTLNPSGGAHSIPLQKLWSDHGCASDRLEPVPGFLVDFLCLKLTSVTLGGGKKIMGLGHIHTAHIGNVQNLERSAAGVATFHFICECLFLASRTWSSTSLTARIIRFCRHSLTILSGRGLITHLISPFLHTKPRAVARLNGHGDFYRPYRSPISWCIFVWQDRHSAIRLERS